MYFLLLPPFWFLPHPSFPTRLLLGHNSISAITDSLCPAPISCRDVLSLDLIIDLARYWNATENSTIPQWNWQNDRKKNNQQKKLDASCAFLIVLLPKSLQYHIWTVNWRPTSCVDHVLLHVLCMLYSLCFLRAAVCLTCPDHIIIIRIWGFYSFYWSFISRLAYQMSASALSWVETCVWSHQQHYSE